MAAALNQHVVKGQALILMESWGQYWQRYRNEGGTKLRSCLCFRYRSETNLLIPELVKIKAKRTLHILHLRKIEAKRILFIPQIRKFDGERTLFIPQIGKIEAKRSLFIPQIRKIEAERTRLIPEIGKIEAKKRTGSKFAFVLHVMEPRNRLQVTNSACQCIA